MTIEVLIRHPFFQGAIVFFAIWIWMCWIAGRAET